jgi:hypothetical protein
MESVNALVNFETVISLSYIFPATHCKDVYTESFIPSLILQLCVVKYCYYQNTHQLSLSARTGVGPSSTKCLFSPGFTRLYGSMTS